MTDKELLQMSLDALEKHIYEYETIEAIKARLAQPEETVNGWPLYSGIPKKEWVGLTDEERLLLWNGIECDLECLKPAQYARAIEAKLKEKNSG